MQQQQQANNNNNNTTPYHIRVAQETQIARVQNEKDIALYSACLKNHIPVIKEMLLHPTTLNFIIQRQDPGRITVETVRDDDERKNNKKYDSTIDIYANPNFANPHVEGSWTPLLLACSQKNGTGSIIRLMLMKLFENICKNMFVKHPLVLEDTEEDEDDSSSSSSSLSIIVKRFKLMTEMANRINSKVLTPFSPVRGSETSPLNLACQNGSIEAVRELMNFVSSNEVPELLFTSSGDINDDANRKKDSKDNNTHKDGRDFISCFYQLQYMRMKALLININHQDKSGSTAAFQCAQGNHANCLNLLIDCSNKQQRNYNLLFDRAEACLNRISKNVNSSSSSTPKRLMESLLQSMQFDHFSDVQRRKLPPLLNLDLCLHSSKSTPLHVAAERGHLAVVRALLLLSNDQESSKDSIAINQALAEKENQKYFLADQKSNKGAPRSKFAATSLQEYKQRASDLFGGMNSKKTSSKKTATTQNYQKVKPAKTNVMLNDSCTPVFIASIYRNFLVLRTILEFEEQTLPKSERSIDYQKVNDKATAVFAAVQTKSVECLRELVVNYGADVNLTVNDSTSPLFLACATHAPPEIIDILCNGVSGTGRNTKIKANVDVEKAQDGATPLFVACQVNNIPAIRLLVTKYGADVNKKNSNRGAFGLMVAAELGHIDVIEVLVKELKADINATNDFGVSCLLLAVEKEKLPVVQTLVKLGADVQRGIASDNTTPLFISAFRGKDPKIFEALLQSEHCDPNVRKTDGSTCVFACCQENRPEFLKLLLQDPRTNPNIPMGPSDSYPLYVACVQHSIETIDMIIADKRTIIQQKTTEGGDCVLFCINKKRIDTLRAVFRAGCLHRKEEMKKLLLNAKSPAEGFIYGPNVCSSVLVACCENDFAAGLKFFLYDIVGSSYFGDDAGEEEFPLHELVNHTNNIGVNVFFAAAFHSLECLKVIIEFISKHPQRHLFEHLATKQVRDGSSPLFAAVMATCQKKEQAFDRVKLLLSSSTTSNTNTSSSKNEFSISSLLSDVDNPKREDGATSLFMACQFGNEELVELLMDHGADPGCSIKNKSNCLHVACEIGHVKVAEKILNHLSSSHQQQQLKTSKEKVVNARNEPFGMQPIWVSAANGHTEAVKLLLENGADKNAVERKEKVSAVFICAQKNHHECLKALLDAGADPNSKKENGAVTPLIVAAHSLRKESVEILLNCREVDILSQDSNGMMANDHVTHVKMNLRKAREHINEAAANEAKRRGIDKMPQDEFDARLKALETDEKIAEELTEMFKKKFEERKNNMDMGMD